LVDYNFVYSSLEIGLISYLNNSLIVISGKHAS